MIKRHFQYGPNEFNRDIWELGEGYTLTAKSVNFSDNPIKHSLCSAGMVLSLMIYGCQMKMFMDIPCPAKMEIQNLSLTLMPFFQAPSSI